MGARGGVSILEEALIGTDCCDIYELVLEDLRCRFHNVLVHRVSHGAVGGDRVGARR